MRSFTHRDQWKRDVIGFDLYRLTPWLQRIHHSDDLDFQEALVEYVTSLNDAHASISFPSPFTASLGFRVDIYDGKVLIESVDRALLPAGQYPFGMGDELVALDGEPVQSLIASLGKYAAAGNERSRDRVAAGRIVARSQQIMPHASQLRDTAIASIRLSSSGALNTFVIPWVKSGIGVDSQGPLPSPRRGNGLIFRDPDDHWSECTRATKSRAAAPCGSPRRRQYPAGLHGADSPAAERICTGVD